jgi:hypothetical protein
VSAGDHREAPDDLLGVEQLDQRARQLEGALRPFPGAADELDDPVQLQQRLAALLLELPPERERLLRHAHPLDLGIGEPEDPGRAVARAARVVELELLVDRDVDSAARQRTGRSKPVDSRSYDCRSHGGIVAISGGGPRSRGARRLPGR